jgi:hypothetical protein
MNLWERNEFFLFEKIDGFVVCGAMNPLISLLAPEVEFTVGLIKILTGGDLQEIFDIPDDPFGASFLVGSPRGAGVERKAIMSREVQKLRIQDELWRPLKNDASKVVIAMPVGYAAHLLEGSDMAIKKKLQGMARIKLDVKITRVSQDQNKSIKNPKGKSPFHPIHLSLFPGQKLQLMKPLGSLGPEGPGVNLYRSITSREPIAL